MSDSEKIATRGASLRKALLGFGLAAGAAWTLASGFVNPAAEIYSSSPRVELAVPYRGICQDIEVLRNGETLKLDRQEIGSGLAQLGLHLDSGEHQLTVRFRTLIPGLEKDYPLMVVVDQVAPQVNLEESSPLAAKSEVVTTEETLELAGTLDEDQCKLLLDEKPLTVNSDLGFQTTVKLEPGWNRMLLRLEDRAGNQTLERYSIFRDTEDPELVWHTVPDKAFEAKVGRIEIDLKDDGRIMGVSGKVNGDQQVKWFRKGEKRWLGITPELIDGEHKVDVKVVDEAGHVITGERNFIINSSEVLGEAVLGMGARGDDVELLHERLAEAGYLKTKKPGRVFTKATEKALKEIQKAEGFEVTGRAEGKVLVALGPRIFVNLRKFSLVLDRPGKPERRWMIASGSWAHPTTPGSYVIKEKVAHPTWLPPKSDWAKDAKPIPPGPGNPLGTRWIGLNGGALGIHGTNAPWSIGSASSHGCMRMVTSQVEELYKLVEVGMPVVVLGGWDDDPRLEKYWPKNPPPKPEVVKDKEVKVPLAKDKAKDKDKPEDKAKEQMAKADDTEIVPEEAPEESQDAESSPKPKKDEPTAL